MPELGPVFGKLVTGTGRRPGGLRLDAARLRLVTRLFDAAGEARRLAANAERDAALAALGPGVWLDAWEEAVGAVATVLVEQIDARLDCEAAAARMPSRLRREARLDEGESGAVAARLGSTGARLVPSLDQLERAGERLRTATARERAALAEWQQALSLAGRRLEAAWLALEDQVDRELAHWEDVAAVLGSWRRSLWPVVTVTVPALVLAGWVGLVLGGYLPTPTWLATVLSALSP